MHLFTKPGAFGLVSLVLTSMLTVASACQQPASSLGSNGNAPASEQRIAWSGDVSQVDAGRTHEHVKRLVALGSRPSGSEAIKKAQDYISGEIRGYGLRVTEDDFTGETPRGAVPMKNIIGELAGARPEIVMVAGHYDTKVLANFVGANDGASSAAAVPVPSGTGPLRVTVASARPSSRTVTPVPTVVSLKRPSPPSSWSVSPPPSDTGGSETVNSGSRSSVYRASKGKRSPSR